MTVREPFPRLGRLKRVLPRRGIRLGLVMAVCALAIPAVAQSAATDLDAGVGLDGWVAGNRPMHVQAVIDSDVLFVGDMQVAYGGVVTRVPVEVPAGGSKTYDVAIRPPVGAGNIEVRLVDADGDRVATSNLRPRVATEEIVVAVDGGDDVIARLGATRTAIDNVPVVPVAVTGIGADLSAVSYLVVESNSMPDEQWDWVRSGGRLVADPRLVDAAPVPLESVESRVSGVDWYRYGEGEVIGADLSSADWSQLIRPAPIQLVSTDSWSSAENQLTRAATGASDDGFATLPWLLGAIVAYAAVVGPLNLYVLRRAKRRELAWLTIPAIAVVALAAFWLAGRQRLEATTLRHATMSVGSEGSGYSVSSVVLAAGTGGARVLGLEDVDSFYAVSVDTFNEFGARGTSASVTVEGDQARFELAQLGVAASQLRGPALPGPSVAVEPTGDGGLLITLVNDTDHTIDYWGALVGSGVAISPRSVSPGDSDTVQMRGLQQFFDPGMGFGDVLVQERQLWSDNGWQVVAPLGGAASAQLGYGRAAVYAISNDVEIPVVLDGSRRRVPGPVVYAVPFDAGGSGDGLARATGDVVAIQDVEFIESYGSGAIIHADSITLRFLVPVDIEDPRLEIGGGWAVPSREFEVYDWEIGEFVPAREGESLDVTRFVSPTGELLVHAVRMGEDQFSGQPIAAGSVTLEWGT